jgi:hypothetical protein
LSIGRKIILAWFVLAFPVWAFTQVHMWREAFFEGQAALVVVNVIALITLALSFASALDSRQRR